MMSILQRLSKLPQNLYCFTNIQRYPKRNESFLSASRQSSLLKTIFKASLVGISIGFPVGIIITTGYSWYINKKAAKTYHLEGKEKKIKVLQEKPSVPVSREVVSPMDSTELKLTLFQYQTCPFCCKVRVFLDYYGISYDIVEVDPVLRKEISWSSYKKVPILLAQIDSGYQPLNDSSMIVSLLASYLKDRSQKINDLVEYYPSPKLKQYQSKIIQVLTNRNIETSPENIINYIAQTILELESDALIMQLYSILFVYKDFVKNSDLITSLILSHIETAFQEKAYRLIRIILNNDRHSINLFKNLLDIFYKTNDKRLRSILELFNIKSEFAVQLYDDNNFIRFYNLYFDELIGKLDFKSRLTNFNTKYAYNLLLKYTNYIINGPKIDQGNLCEKNINLIFCIDKNEETIKISMDLQKVELEYIINLLVSNKDYCGYENTIMKIINQITNYNNIHFLKTKNFVIDLSKNLKNLIKDILTSKSTDLKLAEEFFYINRLFLIPHYISVIREITSVKLLQIIASAVDINVLSQIIKLDVNLLKFSTNNDISVFFSLYEQDNLIINIMPTFLDYCTDHQNLIVKLSDFFCTKIPTDFFVICTTMRNILRSHELNIKKDLILRNLIPKEMSKNIIREITKHELFKVIICHYQHSAVVNDLLFTLGKYIPNLEEDGKIIVDEILLGNLTNLHLLKFFISGMTISLEFLSKLLDECKKNKDYQKKFYEILYYLEKFNKINIDICSDIYADDAISSLQANSLKWRIQYLYLRYTKKCCNSSDYCFINFLMALTSSLYLGNKSCTDVCEGILDDLMISNNKNILLGFIEDNIKNNDINIRCGCLKAYEFILRNYFKDLHLEYMVHIYNYLFKIYKNINALIIIKILCNYIQFTEGVVTKDLIDIIEYYIDTKKKKYRKDLKHLVSLIIDTKSLDLNRRIKQYYKFKIKTDTEEIIIKKI